MEKRIAEAELHARSVSILGHSAPRATWERALERARAEGIRIRHDADSADYLASSSSEPGRWHRVNGSCDCHAARAGRICKHLAAVRSAQAAEGLLLACHHCGHIDYRAHMDREDRYIGGIGYLETYYCGRGVGHRSHELTEDATRYLLARETAERGSPWERPGPELAATLDRIDHAAAELAERDRRALESSPAPLPWYADLDMPTAEELAEEGGD